MEESGVHCTAVYLKQYSPCSVLGPGVRRAQWPDDVFLVVTNFFTSSAPDMQVVFDDDVGGKCCTILGDLAY